MRNIREILDKTAETVGQACGAKVLYDPLPGGTAEAHVRLTFMGTENEGSLTRIDFQASVLASGDGPGVFLEGVVGLSMTLSDLFAKRQQNYLNASLPSGRMIRIFFRPTSGQSGSGRFETNEEETTETKQWRFTYVEPHIISVSVPKD